MTFTLFLLIIAILAILCILDTYVWNTDKTLTFLSVLVGVFFVFICTIAPVKYITTISNQPVQKLKAPDCVILYCNGIQSKSTSINTYENFDKIESVNLEVRSGVWGFCKDTSIASINFSK